MSWHSTGGTMRIDGPGLIDTLTPKSEYCGLAGSLMTTEACTIYGNRSDSVPGKGSLSAPSSLYRGQAGTVRFAVVADVAGDEGDAANVLVDATDSKTVTIKNVRFGTIMEARLYGEGFTITPAGPSRIDAEETGEALWQWTIVPVRATRHILRIEGWVLRRNAEGKLVRARPIHHPAIVVDVPIRWFPEWVHDLMDDSLMWFADGANWLKALSGLVAALAILWTGLRAFRGVREGGGDFESAGR